MPKLCRKIVFLSTKKLIFVSNLTIMNKIVRSQKLIKIFFHLCFVISVFFLFRYNSVLRPLAENDYYKEYLSALFMVTMLYINYLLFIPHFYLKRKTVIYLLLSLTSIVIVSFLEIILLTPNIKDCLPHELSKDEIRKFILVDYFSVCGRNMLFLLFFFMLKIIENEKQIREKEQITLAQSKGYISVPTKDSLKYISLLDIFYIIHEKNYCYIYTLDGNKYSKYISLTKILYYLPYTQFIRVNRNIIVNKNNIIFCEKGNITIYNNKSGEERTFSLSEKYVPNIREKIASAVGLNLSVDGLNSKNDGLNGRSGGLNEGINKTNLEEFMDKIAHNEDLLILCQIIAKDPSVTMKSLSDQLGVSLKTVERRIKILKDKGVLQHSGAKKNGEYVFAPSITESIINWLITDEPVDGDSVAAM